MKLGMQVDRLITAAARFVLIRLFLRKDPERWFRTRDIARYTSEIGGVERQEAVFKALSKSFEVDIADAKPEPVVVKQDDREIIDLTLDSDDEDLVFEEQFILRMPPGEDADRLRKMVQSREVGDDVWFKFKGTLYGLWLKTSDRWHISRFASCNVSYRKLNIFSKTR